MNKLPAFIVVASAFFSLPVLADEVRVLAAGAAKHAVEALAPAFQQATGHTLRASYDTVGALRDRVLQGPSGTVADMVILSNAALEALRTAGRLETTPSQGIGRVVVALAVKRGAALPALSSVDELRQALLTAPDIAYGDPARGATAGTHFASVINTLGMRDALKGKITVLPFGVDVVTGVADGRYALGVSQSSEIMQHHGVSYAGPLPAPYGLSTGYGAALASSSKAAKQLLEFLAGPQAALEFNNSGFVAAP